MDPAYASAIAALAGSAIGGLTSLITSLVTHRSQFRAQQLTHDISRREDLYKDFIVEASKLYADAYVNNSTEPANLVTLVSLLEMMRVISAHAVVERADQVVQGIIRTYQAPNKTFVEVEKFLEGDSVSPLKEFSKACRSELRGFS